MARSDLHDPPADADLLRDARRDPTAFRQLYDRHAERIHGFLLRRTRDADAAIDLTAETLARGCIGIDEAGLTWDCYVGQDAVDQEIITKDFLGEPAGPSRG